MRLLAKRMEEEELTEQQKQRKAQVQFEAQHYTEEDWDAIRAKLEANAELTKSVLGKELPEEDFAKKMVELVHQIKKFFAEERAKARRNTEEKVGKMKEEEPVKRVGKRKKQKARKGISIDKSPQGEILEKKRANGADTVYMSFGAMLKDFTRDDLVELYRLVMQKYRTNRLEDVYDRVLWSDRKTMFDPPLNEDAIWSLPLQQKMIRLEILMTSVAVHCLSAKGLTSPEQTATVEMVFSQPWTCTFLVAKGLTTPELMANWKIIMLQFKNNSKDNAHKILKKLIMKTLKET
ncbi:hypothetical protein Tco_0785740 [Tanacetum coccineum]